jgi:hypothetical protein
LCLLCDGVRELSALKAPLGLGMWKPCEPRLSANPGLPSPSCELEKSPDPPFVLSPRTGLDARLDGRLDGRLLQPDREEGRLGTADCEGER